MPAACILSALSGILAAPSFGEHLLRLESFPSFLEYFNMLTRAT